MPTDLECATLCWSCYNATQAFDTIVESGGVWGGVKRTPDCTIIAFRGSSNIQDWIRDFTGEMYPDKQLGGVEIGFMEGLRSFGKALSALPPMPKIYLTGHSLGAAHALLFGGLLVQPGFPTVLQGITTFGPPRPGGACLKGLLAKTPINSYKNGDDPVCDVPIDIPLIEPYVHPRDLILVNNPPPLGDDWGFPMGFHHIERYIAALQEKQNAQSSPGQ